MTTPRCEGEEVSRRLVALGMAYLLARTTVGPVFKGVTCKLWAKSTDYDGYAKMSLDGHCLRPHRVAFFLARGYWPKPTTDHLCRRRACIEPLHLEAVPQRVNILRGDGPAARAIRQNACGKGHALSEDNVYIEIDRVGRRSRHCRICRRESWQRFYFRNHERRLADMRARAANRRARNGARIAS